MRKLLSVSGALLVLAAGTARAAGEDEAKMKAVIAKAIQAHGGAENLDKYKAFSMKIKGIVYPMGAGVDFTGGAAFQQPDKLRVEIDATIMGTNFKTVQVLNGDKGWVLLNNKTREMDKEEKAAVRRQLYDSKVTRLTPLTDKAFKLSPLGEQKVDGREAVGVRVTHKDEPDVNLYFDKRSGLLVKSEMRVKDRQGQEVNQETFYQEYKKLKGMQVAHKTVVKRDGKLFLESEATDVKLADKLDPDTFAKP